MSSPVARLAPLAVSLGLLLGGWSLAGVWLSPELVPPPWRVLPVLGGLASGAEFWRALGLTAARGALGLGLGLCAALALGIPAGLNRTAVALLGPLVAALQSCPPVLWTSLVMVWAGTGSAMPVLVVFAGVFPPLFANVAQGCAALDPRYAAMARLYRVPWPRRLAREVLPGIAPAVLAGLSYALAAAWKITAVAEYLGADDGLGARMYWAYRMLDVPALFAWASVLMLAGVSLEIGLVARLRRAALRYTSRARGTQ